MPQKCMECFRLLFDQITKNNHMTKWKHQCDLPEIIKIEIKGIVLDTEIMGSCNHVDRFGSEVTVTKQLWDFVNE